MKKLTINSIKCLNETNLPGDDDVFFMVQVDGSPPMRYPIDHTWQMNHESGGGAVTKITLPNNDYPNAPQYVFTNTAYISVWDHDGRANYINQADMLGNLSVRTGTRSGDYYIWGVDSSRYKLNITVEDWSGSPTADGDAIPADLQQLAATAILAWSKTDDGKKAMQTTDKDDNNTLMDMLSDALQSDTFKDVIDKAFDFLPLKAISLGLMGQVEIFVGLAGTFGYAMDLKNWPSTAALFGGGGIVEGVDGGIQGTIALGFWFQETAEIGGFYEAVEIDIDDGLGITAAAYAGKGDGEKLKSEEGINLKYAKVVFLGIDVGLDDGVEAEEAYLFAGHLEDYPSYQTGDYKNQVILTDLKCDDKQSNLSGMDDIHIHFMVDGHSQIYRYPIWNDFEMQDDDDDDDDDAGFEYDRTEWICGTIIQFNDSFDIEFFVNGDSLEKNSYKLSDFSGVGDTVTKKYNDDDDTEYHLTAELLVKG